MKGFARGVAALAAAVLAVGMALGVAHAQAPAGDRGQVSTMIGIDVARSLAPVKDDMDIAAFEKAVRNAFDGGKPLLDEAQARSVGQAMLQRVAAARGQPVPGLAPGATPPAPQRDQLGYLIGFDVGRSLAPIKDELDVATFMRSLRNVLGGGKPALDELQFKLVKAAFSQRMQAEHQAKTARLGEKNLTEGRAFLAQNKAVKGVFTTPSGLQYMVLRQGAGKRPTRSSTVRVNYEGKLLDGKVFDSSYGRGQPAEFRLGGLIAGWQEGMVLMPEGAKYRFWVPGQLGYGANGTPDGSIGPNAVLVFDVELLGIQYQ